MAIKRHATSAAPSTTVVAKRPLTTKAHVAKQCNAIATVVNVATGYPQSVLNIVGGSIPDCLGVPKEDRHPYHQQLIGMVGDVLQRVESSIQNKVSEAESKLEAANTEKTARDTAHQAAKTDIVSKSEALAAAKIALQESAPVVKFAKVSLTEAECAQAEVNAQLDEATKKKARLEFALTDAFIPLEEGRVCEQTAKSKITTVLRAAKECQLDSALLSSVSATLGKALIDRGTFDSLVCQQVKEGLQRTLEIVESSLACGSSGKAKRAQEVETARTALEKAQGHDTRCKAAAEHSKNQVEAAKKQEKETAKAVSQFGHDLNQTRKDLTSARAELEALMGGAMGAYKELLEYTVIVQPAPDATEAADVSVVAD